MEENITNNVVDKAFEGLAEAADTLDKAIVETAAKLPAEAQTKPVTNSGKNIALGVGSFFGGLALGAAFDHWVVPAIGKGLNNLKVKRAEKKAAKQAKKAAKANAKKEKPAEPAPEAPATENDAPDPREHDTKID